jgi:cell division septation protein DedD
MTYDFVLDRKSIVLFLAGWILIALLLFAAGWLLGMNWTASANTISTSASNVSAKDDTLLKEPVLAPDDTQPASVAPGKALGTQSMKSAAAGSSQQTSAVSSAPGQQSKNAASTEAQIVSTQAESDSQGSAEKENASPEADYVTVQIGVFLDEKDASHLLKEMERKGYAPTFFSGMDAEARQWYAVRIGAYSDKQQAANAAANFTKQEKMKAVVRPLGSL